MDHSVAASKHSWFGGRSSIEAISRLSGATMEYPARRRLDRRQIPAGQLVPNPKSAHTKQQPRLRTSRKCLGKKIGKKDYRRDDK
jgi:hypothetical protein